MRECGVVDREAASQAIRYVLAQHPELVGAPTGWEPNAFDGEDARYAGTPGHDATGRVLPYWYWENGVLKSALDRPRNPWGRRLVPRAAEDR